MNTRIISFITVIAFSITSLPARADINEEIAEITTSSNLSIENLSDALIAEAVDTELADDDFSMPQGKEVSKGSDEDKRAARKDLALKIGLAIAAVAVAVAALLIVSNNNGHHYHKK